jgi:hypothetical protein
MSFSASTIIYPTVPFHFLSNLVLLQLFHRLCFSDAISRLACCSKEHVTLVHSVL